MRLLHSSSSPPAAAVPQIQSALKAVSEKQLRQWVERISVPRHFQAQPEANAATANWLAGQFKAWDYEVEFQGTLRNVVAWPRTQSREMILVGAHYDSVP